MGEQSPGLLGGRGPSLIMSTPATIKLQCLLAALSDEKALPNLVESLSTGFIDAVGSERFTTITRDRREQLAPLTVIGVDAEEFRAVARLRARGGARWVAHVTVDSMKPHSITSTAVLPWVPHHLTPRLPLEFSAQSPHDPQTLSSSGAKPLLLAFAGVPGSGKSTVAEAVGSRLGVPVFSLDWVLGALSPFGLRHRNDLLDIGEELLTTLAFRELRAGRSAILDSPAENPQTRHRWETMAATFEARLVPVVCLCSDPDLHRLRVETRKRSIPGWADAGLWSDVQERTVTFPGWDGGITIDTAASLEACITTVLTSAGL